MPVVIVPPPYRGPTHGEGVVQVEAATVRTAMEAVDAAYPGFRDHIFNAEGSLHRFVTLFHNGKRVEQEALDDGVAGEDEIEVVAAIAGG